MPSSSPEQFPPPQVQTVYKTMRFSDQEIWKVPDDPVSGAPSLEICGMQVATRNDVTTVNMLGDRVSMRAYDFGKIEEVPGTGTGNFKVLRPLPPFRIPSGVIYF
jgi:hypothetical protein